jgi:hypothetical protein
MAIIKKILLVARKCATGALADFPERNGLQVIIVPVIEFPQDCQ